VPPYSLQRGLVAASIYEVPLYGVLLYKYLMMSPEGEFLFDDLLVQIRVIMGIIWRTGLAPWESKFPFPSSLISYTVEYDPFIKRQLASRN
jgi:hypothetical protein